MFVDNIWVWGWFVEVEGEVEFEWVNEGVSGGFVRECVGVWLFA